MDINSTNNFNARLKAYLSTGAILSRKNHVDLGIVMLLIVTQTNENNYSKTMTTIIPIL